MKEQALEIALNFAQQQRNEQAERVLNYAVNLELANRRIAELEAELKALKEPK